MDWIVAVDLTRPGEAWSEVWAVTQFFLFVTLANCIMVNIQSNGRVNLNWLKYTCRKSTSLWQFALAIGQDRDLGIKILPTFMVFLLVVWSVFNELLADKSGRLIMLENAIAQGRGQCMSGEYHYFEEQVKVKSKIGGIHHFDYLHFKDGRKLLLGGFESGRCQSSTHIQSVIIGEMREHLGSTNNAEVKVCWMKDLFQNRSKHKGPEFGMCIYEISVRNVGNKDKNNKNTQSKLS